MLRTWPGVSVHKPSAPLQGMGCFSAVASTSNQPKLIEPSSGRQNHFDRLDVTMSTTRATPQIAEQGVLSKSGRRCPRGNRAYVISAIKKRRPEARAIILTGYGNIATAVNAVKLGAVDFLAKPVDADDVAAALLAIDHKKVRPPENPMSADRVRWEHIQRIYELCGHNVSETARRLNMHRRTLQRKLAKRAPK